MEARQARIKAEKKAKSEAKRKIKSESQESGEKAEPGESHCPTASTSSAANVPLLCGKVNSSLASKLIPSAVCSSKIMPGIRGKSGKLRFKAELGSHFYLICFSLRVN